MPQWTIDSPGQLTFGKVTALNVRIVAGRLAVLASDGPPSLEVTEVEGAPLLVTHDEADGRLTVTYKDLTWDGVLGWLRPGSRRTTLTLTVPSTCPVQAGVVSAAAVVTGMEGTTGVKSVSGEIVLDGVSGEVQAETVSGSVESRGMAGDLSFGSVSGELTVAGGGRGGCARTRCPAGSPPTWSSRPTVTSRCTACPAPLSYGSRAPSTPT